MKLLTLGQLRLDGAPVTRAKSLVLLAYLVLEGPRRRRDLAELIFGGSADAADALSTTLRRLRSAGSVIAEEDGRVSACLPCDAVQLRALASSGDHDAVARAYAGEFLVGVALPSGTELEEWALETREALAVLARDALLALAERAAVEGDSGGAGRLAEQALAVRSTPPLEPEALDRWYAALARADGPARARLRADAASLGLRLPEAPPETPTNLPGLLASFVGRDRERAELARALRRPDARLVVVHGPGGVGKTRLAL